MPIFAELYRHMGASAAACMQETWRGEVQQLSWSPRAFLAKGFLSDEECEHIIKIVST